MQKYTWVISIILILSITLGFGFLYFNDHAWGAWGDDSPGYLYLAGRMLQGEPLVFQDELVKKGIEHFGDERLARFLTPTHHEIISPDGWMASIYPIGFSIVMYLAAKISGTDLAIYYLTPLFAVANLILIFLISNLLFKLFQIKNKFYWLFSLFAALTVGLSNLYYDYAISQPMREIPSLFFILIAVYLLLLGIRYAKTESENRYFRLNYFCFIASILLLGFGLNIRHTGIAFLPAFAVLLYFYLKKKELIQKNLKSNLKLLIIIGVLLLIPLIPTIWNSYEISIHKEKFREKDTSGTVLVSNIDHVGSLSPVNMFDNQGKYKPGKGGLNLYWDIMSNMSLLPYFMVLVLLGIFYIWRQNKFISSFLVLWVLGFLALFSMWINPYSRYIIPVFPALAILGSFGLYFLITDIAPKLFKNKRVGQFLALLVVLSIVFIYSPVYTKIKQNIKEEVLINKAISKQDLLTLKEVGNQTKGEKSLLIFTGHWQYGLSETLETHTDIRTIRMPLEQQKFEFDEQKVKDFFDNLFEEGYKIYFWQDSGTQAVTNDFIWEHYKIKEINKYQFSFTEEIILYELNPKN
ncbi:MAG: hypothetical protein ABID45_04480 [Patescibacteria group bacterium]